MTSVSWLLQTTTTAVSPVEVVRAAVDQRGIVLPFQRDQKDDFANDKGAPVVISNAKQILGTRCTDGVVPGEIPWNQAFGSLLYKLRHQNVKPVLRAQARTYVIDALSRWEPRVRVVTVSVEQQRRRLVITSSLRIVDGLARGSASDQLFPVVNELLRAA